MRRNVFVAVMMLTAALVLISRASVTAQPKTSWQAETCFTNSCITEKLNSLSPERAAEAKLTTRHNTTYVWYRR